MGNFGRKSFRELAAMAFDPTFYPLVLVGGKVICMAQDDLAESPPFSHNCGANEP